MGNECRRNCERRCHDEERRCREEEIRNLERIICEIERLAELAKQALCDLKSC